jgi:DNA-binding CsgD family transcriptional regulator
MLSVAREHLRLLRWAGPGGLAAAYTNREIANALGMAEGTVKIHVSNILSKLGSYEEDR